MDKQTFLEELEKKLAALPEDERARLVDYYREMIDDRVEEGLDEAAAVAALGDPAELAGALDAAPADDAGGRSRTVSALDDLRLNVANADVSIVREPLANGAAAQVRFSDPQRFEWHTEGGALVINEQESPLKLGVRGLRRFLIEPSLRVTVALSEGLDGLLECNSRGGDLKVEGVTLGGVRLKTSSGDIRLKQAACRDEMDIHTASGDIELAGVSAGRLRLHTASGDVSADGLNVGGPLRIECASGDIEARSVRCGELAASTASGDIEIDRGEAGAAAIHSASGDVRLNELATDPTLTVETASGDVGLTRCIARETRLTTVGGDVALRLEPLPCGYDIGVNTVCGEIELEEALCFKSETSQPVIAVRTVNGDVEARRA